MQSSPLPGRAAARGAYVPPPSLFLRAPIVLGSTLGARSRGSAREAQNDLAGAIADYEQYLELGAGIRGRYQKEEVEQHIRALRTQLDD